VRGPVIKQFPIAWRRFLGTYHAIAGQASRLSLTLHSRLAARLFPAASRLLNRALLTRKAAGCSASANLLLTIFTALVFLAVPISRAAGLPPVFSPGAVWPDTGGQSINAHGGGILFHDGTYYWYGEFKSGKTILPDCNKSWGGTRVDVVGVSCYSSTNLYDWKNEGIVLPAVPGDPQSDLYPGKVLERPKVIYNHATRQFIMWMHIDSADYAAARAGVAVSQLPTGPFKYLGSFRPNAGVGSEDDAVSARITSPTSRPALDPPDGQMSRDLTVFADDDGQAYLFYSSEGNPTMHVSRLSADYLHADGPYRRLFIGRSMEAPVVFKHAGRYYLIASGCSAWAPNAARSAVADSIMGPWTELGNPCLGPDATNTFHSQGTCVFAVAGRDDLLIFMADRWDQWNLPDSRYIWLPLEFSPGGKPVLRWQDHWSLNIRNAISPAARGHRVVETVNTHVNIQKRIEFHRLMHPPKLPETRESAPCQSAGLGDIIPA